MAKILPCYIFLTSLLFGFNCIKAESSLSISEFYIAESTMSASAGEVTSPPTTPTRPVGTHTSLCPGRNYVFSTTSTGATSYTWYPPSGMKIISGASLRVVTVKVEPGGTSGSLRVRAYNSKGASGLSPVLTVSNAKPDAPVIEGDGERCRTGNVQLCAESANAPENNIKWYLNNSTWKANGECVSLPVTEGTTVNYYARAYISDPSCYSLAYKSVTAKVPPSKPVIEVDKDYACGNESLTFSATNMGSNSYLWNLEGASGKTTPTATYTITNSSNTVTLKAVKGSCSTSADPVNITWLQKPDVPVIEGDGERCRTGNIQLCAESANAPEDNIKWYLNNSTWKTDGECVSLPVSEGTTVNYYARAYVSDPKCYSLAYKSVTAKVPPSKPVIEVDQDYACGNESLTFSATNMGNNSYLWNLEGASGKTTATATYTITNSSNTVTLKAIDGICSTSADPVNINWLQKPNVPVIEGDGERCGTGNIQLCAESTNAPEDNIKWYLNNSTWKKDGECASLPVTEGTTVKYYARAYISDPKCYSSAYKSVTAKVSPSKPVIVVDKGYACGNESLTFSATNMGDNSYLWNLEGASGKTTPTATYTITNSANTVTLKAVKENCSTSADPVNINWLKKPATPEIEVVGNYVCSNTMVTFNEVNAVYDGVWSFENTTETQEGESASFFVTNSNNTAYLHLTNGECKSETASKTVNPKLSPTPPAVISKTRFGLGSLTLEASSEFYNVDYEWLSGSTIKQSSESNVYITGNLASSKVYHVRAVKDGCRGELAAVNAQVIQYSNTNDVPISGEDGNIEVEKEYFLDLETGAETYYRIVLLKYARLEITNQGSTASYTKYSLFNKHGQSLYEVEGYPAGKDSRLMEPDVYYVKVESNGATSGNIRTKINMVERVGSKSSTPFEKPVLQFGTELNLSANNTYEQGYLNHYTKDRPQGSNADDIYYLLNTSDRAILKVSNLNTSTQHHLLDGASQSVGEVCFKNGALYYDVEGANQYYLVMESAEDTDPGNLNINVEVIEPTVFYAEYAAHQLYAINSGNWHDPTIWSLSNNGAPANRIPSQDDIVYIDGQQITFSQNGNCQKIIISNEFGDTSLDVNNGNLVVYSDVKLILKKKTSVNSCEVNVDRDGFVQVGN